MILYKKEGKFIKISGLKNVVENNRWKEILLENYFYKDWKDLNLENIY